MTDKRKPYKTFAREFKIEAVRLMETSERSSTELAMELGIRRNQLYKWNEQLAKHRGSSLAIIHATIISPLKLAYRATHRCKMHPKTLQSPSCAKRFNMHTVQWWANLSLHHPTYEVVIEQA